MGGAGCARSPRFLFCDGRSSGKGTVITYTYDAGTNGKGRLTGASDSNHSMSWTYDAQGRVIGKGQRSCR
jgi:hypothetical protein